MHVCVFMQACVCVCVAKPVAVELRCHATALILKVDKISNDSEKTSNQNTSFTISFKIAMHSPFIFVKTSTDLLALWC